MGTCSGRGADILLDAEVVGVAELRICRGGERFWGSVWRGFVSSGGPSCSGFAARFHFSSDLMAEPDLFCEFATHCGIVWCHHRIV